MTISLTAKLIHRSKMLVNKRQHDVTRTTNMIEVYIQHNTPSSRYKPAPQISQPRMVRPAENTLEHPLSSTTIPLVNSVRNEGKYNFGIKSCDNYTTRYVINTFWGERIFIPKVHL